MVGVRLGSIVGKPDGIIDGKFVGITLGSPEGHKVGN